ncbi:pilus assembly protein [Burkholderia pyrrocinia]|uniref:pilus assembly protein n=1 Tax=Burkholderia pyrrocinia TaxID=60550 RepID=UPI002AB1A8AE|nr:pilus assembly protein [Burkholderia pyrrocinia]
MNLKWRMVRIAIGGLWLAAALSARAEGELMVMPATTKVFNGHDQQVSVRNNGDAPLYLSVFLQKVTNPGMTPEKKVALGDLPHPGILASPDRLTLGPNQDRSISLKSLAEPDSEALYRLYVLPVRSLKVDDAPQDKITAPMSIAVGYGVLVRHMPPPGKQRTGWTHRCERGGITLEATGNVREVFTDVSYGDTQPAQTIAVFPGTPQHFATRRMTLNAGSAPQALACP